LLPVVAQNNNSFSYDCYSCEKDVKRGCLSSSKLYYLSFTLCYPAFVILSKIYSTFRNVVSNIRLPANGTSRQWISHHTSIHSHFQSCMIWFQAKVHFSSFFYLEFLLAVESIFPVFLKYFKKNWGTKTGSISSQAETILMIDDILLTVAYNRIVYTVKDYIYLETWNWPSMYLFFVSLKY
jgi:hypothetical protein